MTNKSTDIPGPGTYDPRFNASQTELPKYSIKGRYELKKKDLVPAPGAYELSFNDKNKAPAFGFGSSPQRIPLSGKNEGVPGPGNYKVPAHIATKNSYVQSSLDEKF
jgi:hypothetical protein